MLTLVFTDLVDSTAVKAALPGADLGERNRAYLDTILTPHRALVETARARFGGRTVDQVGDAYFLVFDAVAAAARFAVAVQQAHAGTPIPTPLGPARVRIGMHTGDPLPDPGVAGRFVGQEVDYTARLTALAEGGQILLSDATACLLRQAMLDEARSHPHGDRQLKGIGRVPVFELLYGGHPPHPLREAALAPDNLPPPPARLTGRADLLAEVRQRLHAGGVTALAGEGGMGKTTLALAAAHDTLRAGDAPGGVGWVNCETRPDRTECLRQAAAVFFGDRCEAEPPDALGRRVLAHLGDRRGLLVLDNFETVAADRELIRYLAAVRPPGRVLVTTRELPAGLAGRVVPVRELDRAAAAELFRTRAAHAGLTDAPPPDLVDALCAAVGDQPLAVELLAARAARTPLARLVEQVRKGLAVLDARGDPTRPDRHQSARACLDLSFDALPEPARGVLLALSVLPADLGPDVVSTVLGRDDWDDEADRLVGASLWRLAGGRYSVHPLVRQWAGERLGPDRAEAARAAAVRLAAAARAARDAAWRPPLDQARIDRHLDWCEAELPTLVAALEAAAAAGEPAAVVSVGFALSALWSGRGYWQSAERVYRAGVVAARALGDPAAEAWLREYLAYTYRNQSRLAESEAEYRAALAVCDAHPAAAAAYGGRVRSRFAKFLVRLGREDEAAGLLPAAIEWFRAAGDRHGETQAIIYLGQCRFSLGQMAEAAGPFADALDRARRDGNTFLTSSGLYELGRTHLETGRPAEAERLLTESLELARRMKNRRNETYALEALGLAATRAGRWAEAEGRLTAAIEIARQLGLRDHEGRALYRLAELHEARGDVTAARRAAAASVAALEGTEETRLLERSRAWLAGH